MSSEDPLLKSGPKKGVMVKTLPINLIKDNYEDTNP
jgi:hypothetical protein